MRKIALTLGLACGLLLLLTLVLHVQAVPLAPAGRHCGDAGPLPIGDPNFCGCTWGPVLFHGQPVSGAVVTLAYSGDSVSGTTRFTELESEPYFDLTAYHKGAQRGDILTLTARFGCQTVSRVFRAWPEADGEQYVALAFPERGVWSPWVTGGYTRALALDGDVVWAGGSAGVISISLTSGISVAHTLPWADPSVRALAIVTDGHVWAAGAGGVAEFDSTEWHTHTVPLAGTPRALAVNPTTGAVWAGDSAGSVAIYTGTWRMAGSFGAPVTALAVDEEGRVWAGTDGNGAYRQDGNGGWTNYRDPDGLASSQALAAEAGGGAVWFGTSPYYSSKYGSRGGVGRYDLTTGAWRAYTTAHGLPPDPLSLGATAPISALAMEECGVPWAGTAAGVWFLASEDWWAGYTTTHGLRPGAIQALVVGSGTAVAATPAGLDGFGLAAIPGLPPEAHITDVSPLLLTLGKTLTLSGWGVDGDENGACIVAWDWSSSLDGPLCTSGTCTLSHSLFTPGVHSIALQVQDDEGVWSVPVTKTVEVKEARRVFLPLALKQLAGDRLPAFSACPDIGQHSTHGSRAR